MTCVTVFLMISRLPSKPIVPFHVIYKYNNIWTKAILAEGGCGIVNMDMTHFFQDKVYLGAGPNTCR